MDLWRPSIIPGFQGGEDSLLSTSWDSGTTSLILGTASPWQGLRQKLPSSPYPTPSWSSLLSTASEELSHYQQHLVSLSQGSAITTQWLLSYSGCRGGFHFLRPSLPFRGLC